MDGVRNLLKLRPKFWAGCEPVANRKGCVGSDAALAINRPLVDVL